MAERGAFLAITTGLEAYQTALLRGFSDVILSAGHPVFAFVNQESYGGHLAVGSTAAEVPAALQQIVRRTRPLGIMITNSLCPQQEQALGTLLRSLGVPVAFVGRDIPGHTSVRGDNEQAMRLLMAHVLDEVGARTPAMVRGLAHQPDHVQREELFRSEITRRGLPLDESLLVDGRAERDFTRKAMRALLRERRDIDAVVTTDDWCAVAVIGAVQEAGLRVPQDVVVTGFDNYPVALLTWPGLTSVDQQVEEQGATLGRALLHEARGGRPHGPLRTPCRLVARASTARGVVFTPEENVAEQVVLLAQGQLAASNLLREANRDLVRCQDLHAVTETLTDSLSALGFRRLFLVVHDDAGLLPPDDTQLESPTEPRPVPHENTGLARQVDTRSGVGPSTTAPSTSEPVEDGDRRSRLVLDFRDGQAHPVTDPFVRPGRLLPEALAAELESGFLALQTIFGTDRTLGYLLTDHVLDPVSVAEPLWVDLARTLEVIANHTAVRAHSEMLERLVEQRTAELTEEVATRRRAEAELERLLEVDGLTQIANRAAFDRRLAEQWRVHADEQAELAVAMIDVDWFKQYNDHYGHVRGDEALRVVAACLQRSVRCRLDLACRFGGEEFSVVLPHTGLHGARIISRRFRRLLTKVAIPHAESPLGGVLTVSVGIATVVPSPELVPAQLVATADEALYRAKQRGRDQVVVADPLVPGAIVVGTDG